MNYDDDVCKADGAPITKKMSMIYLGSLLSSDGRIHGELARRIGSAAAAYNELERLWKHESVLLIRKLGIYEAYVVSRLLYGCGGAESA